MTFLQLIQLIEARLEDSSRSLEREKVFQLARIGYNLDRIADAMERAEEDDQHDAREAAWLRRHAARLNGMAKEDDMAGNKPGPKPKPPKPTDD